MSIFVIPFPDVDPVAIALGPMSIKWYGIAYLAGLLLGWLYIRRLLADRHLWANETPPFAPQMVDDLLLYITLGVVVGGRLGFTLFYEPTTYLANPLEILAVWKGGMSFHGALVGCGVAIWLFASRNRVNAWSTMDLCAAAVPIGLFFGRIANFINSELWGRASDVSWAVVFCNERISSAYHQICPAGTIPRHPSQLYEAVLEGLVLFIVLRILTHKFEALKQPGMATGIFLVGYALARSLAEVFREPHFNVGPLTAGQLYSLPMLVLGLYVLWRVRAAPTAS